MESKTHQSILSTDFYKKNNQYYHMGSSSGRYSVLDSYAKSSLARKGYNIPRQSLDISSTGSYSNRLSSSFYNTHREPITPYASRLSTHQNIETSPTLSSNSYRNQIRGSRIDYVHDSHKMMETYTHGLIAANNNLNRSNMNLKKQLEDLLKEKAQLTENNAQIENLVAYIEYLSSELEKSHQENRELVSLYDDITKHSNNLCEDNHKLKELINTKQDQPTSDARSNRKIRLSDDDYNILNEKDNMIDELSSKVNKMTEMNMNIENAIKDCNEIFADSKYSIELLNKNQKNDNSNIEETQLEELEKELKIIEGENSELQRKQQEQDIEIQKLSQINEDNNKKGKKFNPYDVDVNTYKGEIKKLSGTIEDRDRLIEELKSKYKLLNNIKLNTTQQKEADNNDKEQRHNEKDGIDYKKNYEELRMKNAEMCRNLDELNKITQSLIDAREPMKQAYENTIEKMRNAFEESNGQFSDMNEILKENEDLKKSNDLLIKQIEALPKIEKAFKALLKKNETLRTILSNQQEAEDDECENQEDQGNENKGENRKQSS